MIVNSIYGDRNNSHERLTGMLDKVYCLLACYVRLNMYLIETNGRVGTRNRVQSLEQYGLYLNFWLKNVEFSFCLCCGSEYRHWGLWHCMERWSAWSYDLQVSTSWSSHFSRLGTGSDRDDIQAFDGKLKFDQLLTYTWTIHHRVACTFRPELIVIIVIWRITWHCSSLEAADCDDNRVRCAPFMALSSAELSIELE